MRGSCFGLCTPVRSSRLPLTHTKLIHTQLSHTQLLHTAYSRTTQSHTAYSHTTLSHTTLSHTTLTHTHNLLTHNSHTQLSHTQLTHTKLTHTQLSHTQRAHTQLTYSLARNFCVTGVALGDIDLRFLWQAWHFVTSTFTLCGRRGTYGTGSCGALGPHLMPWSLRLFVWQGWHLATSTFTLCGNLWHWAGSGGAFDGRRGCLCGRRGTW